MRTLGPSSAALAQSSWSLLLMVLGGLHHNSQHFSARNDAIVIRGVHEVATNSAASSETKKLEGKLDALVNLVTQLALNQKSVPVARDMFKKWLTTSLK
ncbi:hypothetical protein HKD37_15G043581 [Glycine soja]